MRKRDVPVHGLPLETRALVLEFVEQGKLIQAIKLVQRVTGVGLKDAKDHVDDLHGEVLGRRVLAETRERVARLIAAGEWRTAVKVVRRDAGMDRMSAHKYVNALRRGRLPVEAPRKDARLSDRVRAFKVAGDFEAAIALVRAETEMSRGEAERFVHALE